VKSVNWFWLNVPLMAVFFLAVAGIPLWLVLRRPDFAAAPADQVGRRRVTVAAQGVPASREVQGREAQSREARSHELVGAAR
jgi:hypothetical protein